MDIPITAERRRDLEHFRHLLFHLQLACGSVHELLQIFQQEGRMAHFEDLKALDPNLMSQLLARECVLEARRCPDSLEARSQLEKALKLDPLCPEACLELATMSDSPEGSMMWYQRCMDATVQLVGGEERMADLLAEFKEKPWQQVETQTWFKAKVCLAEKLFRTGFYDVSSIHLRDLLALDPNDDLKLRHLLMVCLLCENRMEEAAVLAKKLRMDNSAPAFYLRAFHRFRLEGDTRRSRHALESAFRRNMWTPVYLLGMEKMPLKYKLNPPDGKAGAPPFKEGSRREAVECVLCIAPAFCEDNKLVYWMWEALKGLV